jgi:sulfur-carrier protein
VENYYSNPLEIFMRVLFFAQLKDATGCDSIEIALPSPSNAKQLWEILTEKFPALANHRKNVRLARNWEYAASETVFADSDEIALIPPVSGG